jgi:hypothetical protein
MRFEFAKFRFLGAAALLTLTLAACGGGGGSSTPPPPPPPAVAAPSALSYGATPNYTLGTAITALNPTVTGTVTSYSIAPVLPAGLSINATTGGISGTPTAMQAATTHTITATNSGGSATATIVVTVVDVVPSIGYPQASYTFTSEHAISPLVPASMAGGVVTWSIDQALPAGLSFSTATGQITGMATVTSAATTYRVTATNSGGSDFFDVTIGVRSGVLLDVGHASSIRSITYTGTRVLSIDTGGGTRLFDAQTGETLVREDPASCTDACGQIAQIAGNMLVVRRLEGFHVYDVTTGERTATITAVPTTITRGYWDLATDGSYVVSRRNDGIEAWTTAGAPIFSRTTGNYTGTRAFAAPGEYRVAQGPIGAQFVEYIAMPSGTSTQSNTLIGEFNSWFADGQRFFTTSGNVAVVYSSVAVQQWTMSLANVESLAGFGDWVWTRGPPRDLINFYAVGGPSTPAATIDIGTSSSTITRHGSLLISDSGLVIDLSGNTLTTTQVDFGGSLANRALGLRSLSDWTIGYPTGVVIARPTGPQPLQLSLGAVLSIAGGDTRFALAFASGEIRYFDAGTLTQEGSIDFVSTKLALSRDGTSLLALGREPGDPPGPVSLRLYSLPSEAVVSDWPNIPDDFSISDDGSRIGIDLSVIRPDGSIVVQEFGDGGPVRLSPSGNRVVIAQPRVGDDTTSNVYLNGVLSASIVGRAVMWIDENRMLVHRSRRNRPADPFPSYFGSFIVDVSGQDVGALTFDDAYDGFQRVDANHIFHPDTNSIFDVNTGAVVWHNPLGGRGAVAGNYVITRSGVTVRADPR